jgi:glucose-6-phosphate 1-dehydrogenase
MTGDSTLFHRADLVETAWKIVTPILDTWSADKTSEMPTYAAGSWGPQEADALLERDQRHWREP